MEALKEEQQGEESHEARGEVVPEHCESQARLCHCVPGAFNQMLDRKKEKFRLEQ